MNRTFCSQKLVEPVSAGNRCRESRGRTRTCPAHTGAYRAHAEPASTRVEHEPAACAGLPRRSTDCRRRPGAHIRRTSAGKPSPSCAGQSFRQRTSCPAGRRGRVRAPRTARGPDSSGERPNSRVPEPGRAVAAAAWTGAGHQPQSPALSDDLCGPVPPVPILGGCPAVTRRCRFRRGPSSAGMAAASPLPPCAEEHDVEDHPVTGASSDLGQRPPRPWPKPVTSPTPETGRRLRLVLPDDLGTAQAYEGRYPGLVDRVDAAVRPGRAAVTARQGARPPRVTAGEAAGRPPGNR